MILNSGSLFVCASVMQAVCPMAALPAELHQGCGQPYFRLGLPAGGWPPCACKCGAGGCKLVIGWLWGADSNGWRTDYAAGSIADYDIHLVLHPSRSICLLALGVCTQELGALQGHARMILHSMSFCPLISCFLRLQTSWERSLAGRNAAALPIGVPLTCNTTLQGGADGPRDCVCVWTHTRRWGDERQVCQPEQLRQSDLPLGPAHPAQRAYLHL